MTRAESLALLRAWRHEGHEALISGLIMRRVRARFGRHANEAESHGAAAVRAIRTAQHPTIDGFTDWFGSRSEPKTDREVSIELAAIVPYVITESRLAFRAALNAVGLGRNL